MYLERLLTIVEAVSRHGSDGALTVAEIARETGFPKPSVYRQVNDLVEADLLEPRENGRYGLGLRAKRLGGQIVSDNHLRQLVMPMLKKAAREHGVVFFLSRFNGAAVEIIHAEVPATGVSYLHPGMGARPLHACSCAKAIAAFSSEAGLKKALSSRLKAFTEHTKTALPDLEAEFARIRLAGFAECVEELETGICSVAAPVMIDGCAVQFSLGATGTKRVFKPQARKALGGILNSLCAELAHLITETSKPDQTPTNRARKA